MPGPSYIITTVGDSWTILQALRQWLAAFPDNANAPQVREVAEALQRKIDVARGA